MVIDLSRFGLLSGHFYGERSRLASCSKNWNHFSEAAARIAERVHKCARRVRSLAGPVTVSVGLASAVHQTGADFLARLLKRSDEAVYRAKALGRNCTVVSD